MRLRRETRSDREIATRAELEDALQDLGARRDEFAVLELEQRSWAQAAGTGATGFVFEVMDRGRHLQSRRQDLSKGEVLSLFTAWLERDERWRTEVEWGPGPSDPASGAAGGWRPVTFRDAAVALAVALLLVFVGRQVQLRARDATLAFFPYFIAAMAAFVAVVFARGAYRRQRDDRPGGAAPSQRDPGDRGGSPNRMTRE